MEREIFNSYMEQQDQKNINNLYIKHKIERETLL